MGSFISNTVTGYEKWENGKYTWVELGSSFPNQLILTYTTSISSGNIILDLELKSSSGSGYVSVGPVDITIGSNKTVTVYSDRPNMYGNETIWSDTLEYDGKTYSEASISVSVVAQFYAKYDNCFISGTITLPKIESEEYTLTINPSNGSYIDENGNTITDGFPEVSFSDYGYIQVCTDNEDAGAWFNETNGIKGYCISKPKKTGYYISGWKISNSSTGKELSSDYSIIKYSNTSIGDAYLLSPNPGMNVAAMVLWTSKTYTITYNANGGSGTMSTSTATYNQGFKTRQNAFTKTGYTFNGWREDNAINGTYWGITSSNSGTYESGKEWVWTYDKNITLYAQWKPKTYTITYNANGGSGTMANSTATYNVGFKTKENTFTRLGYKFIGWREDNAISGTFWGITSSYSGTYESGRDWVWTYDKNITLYAQWEPYQVVRVYTDNDWKLAVPYIYQKNSDGTFSWKRAAPYVYNGGWKETH